MNRPHIFDLMAIDAEASKSNIWETQDGMRCPIADLGASHLLNIIRMLRKAAKQYVSKTVNAYLRAPYPQGEMAQLAYESELAFWSGDLDDEVQTSPENEVLSRLPWWDALQQEVIRRGLTEKSI